MPPEKSAGAKTSAGKSATLEQLVGAVNGLRSEWHAWTQMSGKQEQQSGKKRGRAFRPVQCVGEGGYVGAGGFEI